MAMQYVPARDMVVQVRQADGVTWSEVEGLSTIGEDPSVGEQYADATVNADQGRPVELATQRGAALDLSGLRMRDTITGAHPVGQARCYTLADGLMYANVGAVRWRDNLETQWKVWETATFRRRAESGDSKALKTFSMLLVRNGAGTTAAVV